MIKGIKILDCSMREIGYQTGWNFDKETCRKLYTFALGKGIDYLELGFLHNPEYDLGNGMFRYCTEYNDAINEVFLPVKNRTKITAMRHMQSPLTKLVPRKNSVIDAIRIMTKSYATNLDDLKRSVDECREMGYEVFINFVNAGHNLRKQNEEFARFCVNNGVEVIYFADTESIMTHDYVINAIKMCHDMGLQVGMHFHDKNGTAEFLADTAIENGTDFIDVTQLGLGGKWRDGNLTMDYILHKMGVTGGYELSMLRNEIIGQLIKYNERSKAE